MKKSPGTPGVRGLLCKRREAPSAQIIATFIMQDEIKTFGFMFIRNAQSGGELARHPEQAPGQHGGVGNGDDDAHELHAKLLTNAAVARAEAHAAEYAQTRRTENTHQEGAENAAHAMHGKHIQRVINL